MSTTIAIVQYAACVLDLEKGVQRAVAAISEAAHAGAKVAVFPESWLTGYPAWVFGMAGWNDAEARYWYGQFLEQCVTIDDERLAPIRETAKANDIVVCMGLNEKLTDDAGSVLNSILFIGADGQTINVHRKLTPTHTEKNIWAQGDASGLNVVSTPVGRIGGLVCWEHWQPLIRHALHCQDEQLHIACWPDMPDSHALASRHYAFEGRCYVAAAAQYVTVADVPEALVDAYRVGIGQEAVESDSEILFPGGSGIVGPDGNWVTAQVFDKSALVLSEIDLSETARFKHDLDVSGHYSRPDIFTLQIDRRVQRSVTWLSDDDTATVSP